MSTFLLESQLTPDQRQMVVEAHGSGQRLLRLVRDTLDAVAARTGEAQAAGIPFDLRVIADEMAALLREHAREKDKTIDLRVHHEVPSRLMGDPARLRQVLWNLGECSIESHGAGCVALRVSRLREDDASVVLRFELRFQGAFQSGSSTSDLASGIDQTPAIPVISGPGFRLAIAQRLAAAMGARLAVETDADQTYHMWFDLTLGKQREDAARSEISADTPTSLAGRRALVVDPTEAIRHVLVARLESYGCQVAQATTAEEGVQLWGASAEDGKPFQFLLVERDLPFMSAHDLGAYLRAQPGGDSLRMVLFAGVGRQGDLELARASGFDAYLPKNIDARDLETALTEIERVALAPPAEGPRPLVTRHWLAEMRRSRMRILIVEDDVVSVMVTDWTMRRIGYQVVRVASAAEMRKMLGGDVAPFDLVILALHLPDADGISVIDEIHAANRGGQAPAILTIGHECTKAEQDRCTALGVDAYIPRPVDLAHLCEVVETITRTGSKGEPGTEGSIEGESGPLAMARRQERDHGRVSFKLDAVPADDPTHTASRPAA